MSTASIRHHGTDWVTEANEAMAADNLPTVHFPKFPAFRGEVFGIWRFTRGWHQAGLFADTTDEKGIFEFDTLDEVLDGKIRKVLTLESPDGTRPTVSITGSRIDAKHVLYTVQPLPDTRGNVYWVDEDKQLQVVKKKLFIRGLTMPKRGPIVSDPRKGADWWTRAIG